MRLRKDTQDTEPGGARIIIWTSLFSLLGFVAWAHWAELDQITRASGQVVSSSRNQVIQAPEGGVLEALLVREGTQVRKGQELVRFERAKVEAGYLESASRVAALRAAEARWRAEATGGMPVFPEELAAYPSFKIEQSTLFQKRRQAFTEELGALQKAVTLVNSELDMHLPLLASGDVSRAEVLKLQRQAADIQAQVTNRQNRYSQEAQTELAKAQEELSAATQVLAQRREQVDYTVARAPMDGIVRNVRLTTRGGVARPGEEIMQIVPLDDDLLVEAKVRPADIAFVKRGLPATVKFDAYDYTIYGALPGEVSYISADTLNEEVRNNEAPYFRVQIRTSAQRLAGSVQGAIDIQPGMTATIEIKTGTNSVWRYLTKPITKTLRESLGER